MNDQGPRLVSVVDEGDEDAHLWVAIARWKGAEAAVSDRDRKKVERLAIQVVEAKVNERKRTPDTDHDFPEVY